MLKIFTHDVLVYQDIFVMMRVIVFVMVGGLYLIIIVLIWLQDLYVVEIK